MDRREQAVKAERLRELHHAPPLLVLPNVWDPLGARIVENEGLPAVATASAAVAFSLGFDDGERISFDTMLEVVGRIAAAVRVPVTADIERGYAVEPAGVQENVRLTIRAGAAGINLEDSRADDGDQFPVALQCDRIRAARSAGEREGVPIVINARTDVLLGSAQERGETAIAEVVARARAYLDAGADCIYPIPAGDVATLARIRAETGALLNAFASAEASPMRELEEAGVARISIGPGLIRASVTAIRSIVRELAAYGSYDGFARDAVGSDEIRRILSSRPGS